MTMQSTAPTSLMAWQSLWSELNLAGNAALWHGRLVTAYQDPAQRYHNLQHIEECLWELRDVQCFALEPTQLRFALWFHDAVYDSHSARNEEDSAELAASCLETASAPAELVQGVRELVMSTKSHAAGRHPDAGLMIDIDLAILGQPNERFDSYELGIRAEYEWVPLATYCSKRAEILTGFLARPTLYTADYFRSKYETAARHNLARSITRLRAGTA